MKSHRIFSMVVTVVFLLPCMAVAQDSRFIEGYAAALIAREFGLDATRVRVDTGTVTLDLSGTPEDEHPRIIELLLAVEGVELVQIVTDGHRTEAFADPEETPAPAALDPLNLGYVRVSAPSRYPSGRRRIFEPLIADPRWPHFSVAYQVFMNDDELENVGSASLGETYSFWRSRPTKYGQIEFGPQAAVFAIFDFDGPSNDLINADYFVAGYLSYRYRAFSSMFRVLHQSSHLGDEYLLREDIERVNLSYEAVDLHLSYDLSNAIRIYVGGGALINKEPDDLESWGVQYGFQLTSPVTFFNDYVRPIAAANFSAREANGWEPDISARAGFQIESPRTDDLIQILIEYFNGKSPNGQFYDRDLEYLGIGLHIYF